MRVGFPRRLCLPSPPISFVIDTSLASPPARLLSWCQVSKEKQPERDPKEVLDSTFECLLKGLAQSPLYGPLVAPALRRRELQRLQDEAARNEIKRKEELAVAEHERRMAEIRDHKVAEPLPSGQRDGKLPPKRHSLDLDRYDLTDRQHEVASLRWEHALSIAKIARRLGIHRSVVAEHLEAAKAKINQARSRDRSMKKHATVRPDD